MKEKPNATHALPIGAVVIYRDQNKTAKLIVVQHSQDCDKTPLYMVAENAVSPPDAKLYSRPYLLYRLRAGCYAGNVPLEMLRDTGDRVNVLPFDEMERVDEA